jgi:hypothetical protein
VPSRNLWRRAELEGFLRMQALPPRLLLWRQRNDRHLDVKLWKWIYMCGRIESLRATSFSRWRSLSKRTVLYYERGWSAGLWTWNIQSR